MEARAKERIALSIYFFLSGICFSTWASRIPTIKAFFNLNDAELGTILLARLVLKEHVATTQKVGIAISLTASLLLALA